MMGLSRLLVLAVIFGLVAGKKFSDYTEAERNQFEREIVGVYFDVRTRDSHISKGLTPRCGGDNECCSEWNQCMMAEGDCDSDNECIGDLVCSDDGCNKWIDHLRHLNGGDLPVGIDENVLEFSATDDCCWLRQEAQDYINELEAAEGIYGKQRRFAKMTQTIAKERGINLDELI